MNHSGPSVRYRWPEHPEPEHSCKAEVARQAGTYLVLFLAIPLAMMGDLMQRRILNQPPLSEARTMDRAQTGYQAWWVTFLAVVLALFVFWFALGWAVQGPEMFTGFSGI